MTKQPFLTSVNLDEETHKIAQTMSNRSAFIRECFREWNRQNSTEHIAPLQGTPVCFPYAKRGRCRLCYPGGPPNEEVWKEFIKERISVKGDVGWYFAPNPNFHDLEFLMDSVTPDYGAVPIPDNWGRKKTEEKPSRGGVKAFLRRFLRLKFK